LNLFAPWLGVDLPDSATPLERSGQLSHALPEGKPYVQRIVGMYVEDQYAPPRPLDDFYRDRRNAEADTSWKFLRPRFMRAAVGRLARQITSIRLGRGSGRS
jgi:hypothetical protein